MLPRGGGGGLVPAAGGQQRGLRGRCGLLRRPRTAVRGAVRPGSPQGLLVAARRRGPLLQQRQRQSAALQRGLPVHLLRQQAAHLQRRRVQVRDRTLHRLLRVHGVWQMGGAEVQRHRSGCLQQPAQGHGDSCRDAAKHHQAPPHGRHAGRVGHAGRAGEVGAVRLPSGGGFSDGADGRPQPLDHRCPARCRPLQALLQGGGRQDVRGAGWDRAGGGSPDEPEERVHGRAA
mmetsp:Transcript_87407/g.225137  ORF Transcript_87407/g.225137 Transcript_87407/m.225137 type:complete len:231 (-) Transcript_87407:308-1000(-)